jgi:hypothetical protein
MEAGVQCWLWWTETPGAALTIIFELPKLAMMALCSCFARRVKSACEGSFFRFRNPL